MKKLASLCFSLLISGIFSTNVFATTGVQLNLDFPDWSVTSDLMEAPTTKYAKLTVTPAYGEVNYYVYEVDPKDPENGKKLVRFNTTRLKTVNWVQLQKNKSYMVFMGCTYDKDGVIPFAPTCKATANLTIQ